MRIHYEDGNVVDLTLFSELYDLTFVVTSKAVYYSRSKISVYLDAKLAVNGFEARERR